MSEECFFPGLLVLSGLGTGCGREFSLYLSYRGFEHAKGRWVYLVELDSCNLPFVILLLLYELVFEAMAQ